MQYSSVMNNNMPISCPKADKQPLIIPDKRDTMGHS